MLVDQGPARRGATSAPRRCASAGGVAANSLLRARVEAARGGDGPAAFLPSRALCTDNAAMVAAAGLVALAPPTARRPLDARRRPQPARLAASAARPEARSAAGLGRGCPTGGSSLSLALATVEC